MVRDSSALTSKLETWSGDLLDVLKHKLKDAHMLLSVSPRACGAADHGHQRVALSDHCAGQYAASAV